MRAAQNSRNSERDWRSYRAALQRFVSARVSDPAAAEDIVQETLTRAYARRDMLTDESKFRPWLHSIARNTVADHYRTRRLTVSLPENLTSESGKEEPSISLARCLPPFVERLPSPYRRAIELSELYGLTQRETASRLGLSVPGAKSRVQRARKLLARMLRECCELDFDARGALSGYQPTAGCCQKNCC